VYYLEQVLYERDYYRSQTCPRRAYPLGLPLSAYLDSVLSNILLPARCSWYAEFCMHGCKISGVGTRKTDLAREMGEGIEEIGEKMGEERCEGERGTAQVSSCRCGCECTVVTDSGPLA
jgi:hypothetical protein